MGQFIESSKRDFVVAYVPLYSLPPFRFSERAELFSHEGDRGATPAANPQQGLREMKASSYQQLLASESFLVESELKGYARVLVSDSRVNLVEFGFL
ncbi:hypothetical protein GW17_00026809 [Ensete ventricosum]|nr:hypothetical protein GW17_00026809 [Ensete ventricosum]RZR86513.1 hypothetical protein BHM03_00013732 [Ensete ventricosum]